MPSSMSESSDPIALTGDIVSAFVTHNSLPSADLPALIHSVHAALVRIVSGAVTPDAPEPAAAAVSVRKSITPDYLVCLDDGLKFKSLRRHLAALGMTPDEYTARSGSCRLTIRWSRLTTRRSDRNWRSGLGLANCAETVLSARAGGHARRRR